MCVHAPNRFHALRSFKMYGGANAANREPLVVGRHIPRMLLGPTYYSNVGHRSCFRLCCTRAFHSSNLFLEDALSAARASGLENGRRSGPRRKATRRVERVHAQELVQDNARDACRAERCRRREDAWMF